jgi:hypothetical protein
VINILNSRKRLVRTLAIAGVISLFTIATASAAFKLRLTTGGGATVTVTDGDLDGVVNFTGALGSFTVNVTTGLSKPTLGNANLAFMDLNSVNVSGGAADTLLIELTDTGFSLTGNPALATQLSTGGGTLTAGAGSSVDFTAAVDTGAGGTNEFTYPAGTAITSGPFGSGAFAFSQSNQVALGGPFAMSQKVFINLTAGGGIVSFDHEHKVLVPEASSLALLLPGLAPLGLVLRRRLKNTA